MAETLSCKKLGYAPSIDISDTLFPLRSGNYSSCHPLILVREYHEVLEDIKRQAAEGKIDMALGIMLRELRTEMNCRSFG